MLAASNVKYLISNRCRNRRQAGDTIIEVLLAMAVIGIVLGTSFGLANQAVRTGRDAHERGEALKLAESQLELLKSYTKASTGNIISHSYANFCVDMTPSPYVVIASGLGTECADIDTAGNSGGLYSIGITRSGSPPNYFYTIKVEWDQITSQTNDSGNVTLYYRTGVL